VNKRAFGSTGLMVSGCLLALGDIFQCRQPKVVSAMHETFICLAEMGRVLALADLVGHHEAHVSLRLQIPGVIKGRRRAGRVAVPIRV
jgi:hypothetical protein